MKRKQAIITTALVLVALYFGKQIFFPNEAKIIKKQLLELAATASISKQEHPFERLAKAKTIGKAFAKEISIELKSQEYEISKVRSRAALVQKVMAVRSMIQDLDLNFLDMELNVHGDQAEAHFTVKAQGTHPSSNEPFYDAVEVKFYLEKRNSTWLITKVENIESVGY